MIAPTDVRTGCGKGRSVMMCLSCSLLKPASIITVTTRP
jgi:hypothetical protein